MNRAATSADASVRPDPTLTQAPPEGLRPRPIQRALRFPFYPLLLAAYPVLLLYSENLDEGIALTEAVWPLGITLAITAAVYALTWLAWRSWVRAAIVTSAIILPCLLFGPLVDAIEPLWPESSIVRMQLIALLVWLVIALLTITLATRGARHLPRLTETLNVAAIALVVLVVVPIARYSMWPAEAAVGAQPERAFAPNTEAARPGRDIYHFVFDRYGSEAALDAGYGFDNSEFIAWLKEQGFQVVDDARANYWRTLPSLSSMFRMSLLDDIAVEMGPDNPNPRPLQQLLLNNPAAATLQQLGYTYAHLGSWYREFTKSNIADYVASPDYQVDFGSAVFENTAIPFARGLLALVTATGPSDGVEPWAQATLEQFERVESMAELPSPKFVYAHFLVPHRPYVFLEDGTVDPQHATYESQVLFANAQIRRLLEPLLAKSEDEQPIIILQADEGPYPARYDEEGTSFDWASATDAELVTKFGILSAWYLPGPEGDAPLPGGTTLVNTYPEILRRYFGLDIPYAPNRSYGDRYGRLYDLVDLTDRLSAAK